MPAVRRLRILILTVAFAIVSLFYLTNKRNTWNYGYTPYPDFATGSGESSLPTRWKALPDRYPVSSYIPLPTGRPKKIPAVQAPRPDESEDLKSERLRRRDVVKESFQHSWTGYKQNAWLRDEVGPLSGKPKDSFGGWAATLVDSLDTLWIMGLKEDFEAAVKAAETIDFSKTDQELINVFETTIRYMGGFLGAYDISGGKYKGLLRKAKEVGDLLMSCFDTPNRMPITRWPWQRYAAGHPQVAPKRMLVSEIGSLSLEFTRLSQLTGDPKYYDAIQRIYDEFEKSQNSTLLPGMWPVTIDASGPSFSQDNFFTLGGMSDSLYEYFPKQYLLLGGIMDQPKTLYENFIEVAKTHLFYRIYNPKDMQLSMSGDIRVKGTETGKESDKEINLKPRGQHLTCFVGGMVALASKLFSRPNDISLAEELTDGCVWAYDASYNGVAPEIFTTMPCPKNGNCHWNETIWHEKLIHTYSHTNADLSPEEFTSLAQKAINEQHLPPGFTAIDERKYILRPEAIESVFILYRLTGLRKYQEAAWRMFQAVEKATRTTIAAAGTADITVPRGEAKILDTMESFWLAETLKYFYLCFDEWDVVNLDDWVLNTEAHPLKRLR